MKKNSKINFVVIGVLLVALTLTLSVVQYRQVFLQHAQENDQNQNQSSRFNNNGYVPNITLPPKSYTYQAPNDTTPPLLKIINPASGTLVKANTSLTITATANDNTGVTRVEFLVDGGIICTANTQPYTCAWAVPNSQNLLYTIVVRAFDATGNIASKSIIVRTF